MKLGGRTSAVSGWNKKTEETRVHCHDRTRPELARAGNQRPNLEVFLGDFAAGGRTHAWAGFPTRWVCYDPPVKKVRTVFVAQSPAGSMYLVSAAERNAARSRSGKKYRTRRMPALARTGNGPARAISFGCDQGKSGSLLSPSWQPPQFTSHRPIIMWHSPPAIHHTRLRVRRPGIGSALHA